MANQNEIKVTVVFATAGAKKNVREFSGELQEMEQKTGKASKETGKQLTGLEGTARKALGRAGMIGLVAGTTGAVVAGFNRSIQKGKEFQSSLAELEAITGISGEQLDSLADRSLDLSVQYGESASQIIEANKLVASQLAQKIDFGTAEGLRELQEVSEQAVVLQKAAGIDLPTAVGTLTTAINQFNLPASETNRLIQSIAAGSKFGAAEVRDQSEAYRESGSVAASAGLEFEELNGAVQVLAANAIKGSQAGTNMRNVILTLNNPSKLAAEGIEGVNIQSDGLSGSLEKLKPLLEDSAALEKLFGRESITTAQILIRNAAGVEEMTEQVTGSNVATEQAAVQMNTYEGAMDRLTNAMDKNLIAAFQETNSVLVTGINLMTDWVVATGYAVSVINDFFDAQSKLREDLKIGNIVFDERISQLDSIREEMAELYNEGNLSIEQQRELKESWDANTESIREEASALFDDNRAMKIRREELEKQIKSMEELPSYARPATMELQNMKEEFEALGLQIEKSESEYVELLRQLETQEIGFEQFAETVSQLNEAHEESADSSQDQAESVEGLSDQIKILKDDYEELLNLPTNDIHSVRRIQQLLAEIRALEKLLETRRKMSENDPTEQNSEGIVGANEDAREKWMDDLAERQKSRWEEVSVAGKEGIEDMSDSGVEALVVLEHAFVNGINTAIDQTVRSLLFAEGKMLDLEALGKNLFSGILSGLAKYGLVAATGGTGSIFASILGFANGGPIPGYSTGGRITGPGSGRSDSILMRGSRGEYMLNQRSTTALGAHRADRINRSPAVAKAVGSFIDDMSAGRNAPPFQSDYRPASVNVSGMNNNRDIVEKLDEVATRIEKLEVNTYLDYNQFRKDQAKFDELQKDIGKG